VVLFDESFAFREHRERWLYTAVTRAAERVTVVV
jgi:exodeoxyribonuclease V